jgi:hypothetical protein
MTDTRAIMRPRRAPDDAPGSPRDQAIARWIADARYVAELARTRPEYRDRVPREDVFRVWTCPVCRDSQCTSPETEALFCTGRRPDLHPIAPMTPEAA